MQIDPYGKLRMKNKTGDTCLIIYFPDYTCNPIVARRKNHKIIKKTPHFHPGIHVLSSRNGKTRPEYTFFSAGMVKSDRNTLFSLPEWSNLTGIHFFLCWNGQIGPEYMFLRCATIKQSWNTRFSMAGWQIWLEYTFLRRATVKQSWNIL